MKLKTYENVEDLAAHIEAKHGIEWIEAAGMACDQWAGDSDTCPICRMCARACGSPAARRSPLDKERVCNTCEQYERRNGHPRSSEQIIKTLDRRQGIPR